MRSLIFLTFLSGAAQAQIPDIGVFRYGLFDKSDRPVGSYGFSISKEGPPKLLFFKGMDT